MNLKLDWCTHEAAKYSCEQWHYSGCMPAGKLVKVGVWEDDIFIGSIIYGMGANNNLAKSFGLKMTECCELTRVALTKHKNTVSKILSISVRFLRKKCPGLKLIVSYADKTNQEHHGGIYQACGWDYLGERTSKGAAYYIIKGKKMHGRSVRAKWGSEKNIPFKWTYADAQTKHIYVKSLDKSIQFKCQSYPKRATSIGNDAASYQLAEDGATPIVALPTSSSSAGE